MTELQTFLRAILTTPDLDGAGALADWLDEHNDPRGRLLRARWKKWRKDREEAVAQDKAAAASIADPFLKFVKTWRANGGTVEQSYISVHLTNRQDRIDRVFARYFLLRFHKDMVTVGIAINSEKAQGTLRHTSA